MLITSCAGKVERGRAGNVTKIEGEERKEQVKKGSGERERWVRDESGWDMKRGDGQQVEKMCE